MGPLSDNSPHHAAGKLLVPPTRMAWELECVRQILRALLQDQVRWAVAHCASGSPQDRVVQRFVQAPQFLPVMLQGPRCR